MIEQSDSLFQALLGTGAAASGLGLLAKFGMAALMQYKGSTNGERRHFDRRIEDKIDGLSQTLNILAHNQERMVDIQENQMRILTVLDERTRSGVR
jgi:hypothetical protein